MEAYDREHRYACMATMPSRKPFLPTVLASLKHQVDRLFIYCNYPQGEPLPEIVQQDWISILHAGEARDLGCTGRIFLAESIEDGYVFLVDDDIVYGNRYIDTMIDGIERYGRRALISCHGGILPGRVDDFTVQRQLYDFDTTVPTDRVVNIAGLGVCGYHTSTIRVTMADFPSTNRDDLWMALKCQAEGVPMIVLGRRRKICKGLYDDFSLWGLENSSADFSREQTRLARKIEWKIVLPTTNPGISFILLVEGAAEKLLYDAFRLNESLRDELDSEFILVTSMTQEQLRRTVGGASRGLKRPVSIRTVTVSENTGSHAGIIAGVAWCRHDIACTFSSTDRVTPRALQFHHDSICRDPQIGMVWLRSSGQARSSAEAALRRPEADECIMFQRHVAQALDNLYKSRPPGHPYAEMARQFLSNGSTVLETNENRGHDAMEPDPVDTTLTRTTLDPLHPPVTRFRPA